MLFRRDLGRSGSALACNILAGRPKGTHMAVVPRRANARQPPPPHAAQSVRAGVPWAGRWQGVHWPLPACVRTPTACCHMPAQHARTAPGTAVPTHGTGRPALLARAFAPPKHAPKARRLAPCARLTSAPPLCRSDLTVQEEGVHRTSRARSSRRSRRAASGGRQGPAAKPRPAPAAPLPASQPPRARARVG